MMHKWMAASALPNAAEAGVPGHDFNGWCGHSVPAGTHKAVVDKLNATVVKAVQSPVLRARLTEVGIAPTPPDTPAQFAASSPGEVAKWARVAREAEMQAAD
jgi:tripartite-type tricarboxylate transporter receptor subunit TctC